jgi:hypothetical protein
MGATFFKTSHRGKSLSDAYKDAKDCAEEEYGHDPYNGTISTTQGVQDVTAYYKASGKSLNDYIDSWVEKGLKRDCYAICLEEPKANTNKIKSHVQHIVTPGTKKWILKYIVMSYDGEIGSYDTKGDAVKAARAHTEKYLSSTTVHMEKRIDKANAQVAKITYKRSDKEKDGKWVFFGWAAE